MRFIYLVAARVLGGIQHRYLSMVSRIAILGIAIGAATLVVVFSISSGITTAFKGKILALYPHVAVTPKTFDFRNYRDVVDILSTVDGVVEAIPATYDEVMVVHKDRREEVILKGVPLSNARMQELLGSVSVSSEPSAGGRPPSMWSGSVTVSAVQGRVQIRGGIRGTTARILVLEQAKGAVQSWIWDDLWMAPVGGADRIIVASEAELEVVCERDQLIQNIRTPKSGGFSRETLLEAGTHSCVVREPNGRQDLAQWTLSVSGGAHRTIILLSDGEYRPHLDIQEPDLSNNTVGRVRVYWPNKDQFQIQAQDESTTQVQGSTSAWLSIDSPLPSILLGSTVARKLRVQVGDTVDLLTHSGGLMNTGRQGGLQSQLKSFHVSAIMHSGFHDFDHRFIFADLTPVQRLFQRGDNVYWIEVKIADLGRTSAMVRRIQKRLDGKQLPDILERFGRVNNRLERMTQASPRTSGRTEVWQYLEDNAELGFMLRSASIDLVPPSNFTILDWREMNQTFLSAIFLQQVILTIIFFIIVLVAASNVVGNQIMLIHEKTTTISILRAMGASQRQIKRIFHLQGLITALVGSVIGCIVGTIICFALASYDLTLNAEIYFIEEMPVSPSLPAIVVVIATTLMGTWLATHISAKKAARLNVLDGIHRVE